MKRSATHPYPRFLAALLRLGATNAERAERLGVCVEVISFYRTGRQVPATRILLRAPELLLALYQDTQDQR